MNGTIRWMIQDQVLHIIFPCAKGKTMDDAHESFITYQNHPERYYSNPELCREVLRASVRYEGENKFVGFNLPTTSITDQEENLHYLCRYHPEVVYLIAYMENDHSSLSHELLHARFYIDADYRKQVIRSWNHLQRYDPVTFNKIHDSLTRQKYDPKVFIDEFQAYYPELIKNEP